ncbi:MAG TPA: LLM class flavin-dependent oxidoreductase [Gemmatimonadales bacterium]|nr:LLM class flavin-dependent oxidoreductase [Gemmatimonadales bacterium]
MNGNGSVSVYSTCPPYRGAGAEAYLQHVRDVARWSEAAGCEGILVYTDNGLLDPWLVAQVIVQHTARLAPLVAVQPVYMHPYSVAKMVTSLAYLYGRRIDLNMVAGGFKNDLTALNDETPHDQRYARLTEYTSIILRLLAGREPVTERGSYYTVTNLTLTPALPPALFPRVTVSGSSEAGLAAARALGALSVRYPGPPAQAAARPQAGGGSYGIRVGIIARPTEEEAWTVAHGRFPPDRRGQVTHQLAMKVSDSSWHKQLSEISAHQAGRDTYWMVPFENYKTFCPYLVGTYDRVGDELGRYFATGCNFVILDVPASEGELDHLHRAIDRARSAAFPA